MMNHQQEYKFPKRNFAEVAVGLPLFRLSLTVRSNGKGVNT